MSAFFIILRYHFIMKTLFTLVFLVLMTIVAAQKPIHYDSLRLIDSYSSCQVNDSIGNETLVNKLEKMDTSVFVSGLSTYFRDLGFCYYKKYIYSKDTNQLTKAIELTGYSWEIDNSNSLSAWDLGIFYFFKGDCDKSIIFFDRYRKIKSEKKEKLGRFERRQIKQIKQSSKCKVR